MPDPKHVAKSPSLNPATVAPGARPGKRGLGRAAPASGIDALDRLKPAGTHPAGLPAALRAGAETLSGLDLGGVRVHADSPRPAAMGALAYAQGSDIHLAPGQQVHLPHEAWHVVQQLQGRARVGWQAQGLPVNADAGLEAEADVMGALAMALKVSQSPAGLRQARSADATAAPIQRVKETEFKANPDTFLRGNLLTLDFQRGMAARAPGLGKGNDDFIKKMSAFTQHWFQLAVDAGRSTATKPAYFLAPAIEKYVGAFGALEGNAWLAELGTKVGLPAAAAEGQYIQAAYIPYLTKKVEDPDVDVGHTAIKKSSATEGFNPDFVFTDVMNGCAFTVTEGADDEHIEAWHFQSPGSNKPKAAAFRRERNPLDWFGEEEYDKGGHKGLYETTNLLYRKDDAWNVLSQVNDASATDRNTVHSSTVTRRALNVGADGRDRLGMLKRIYQRNGENQHYDANRQYINALKPTLELPRQKALHAVCMQALLQLQADTDAVAGATSIPALRLAATQRKRARAVAKPLIDGQINTEVQILEALYQTAIANWSMLRNEKQEQQLNLAIQALTGAQGLQGIFADVRWLTQLETETA